MFVGQLGDQREFLFDLRLAPYPECRAASAAPRRSQVSSRRVVDGFDSVGHQFLRISVFELAQVERAQRRDAQRFGEQVGRIQRGKVVEAAQMSFAIREQRVAGLGDRAAETDRGHHILQRASAPHVHVHVAGRDQRQVVAGTECTKFAKTRRIVRATVQFDRDPRAACEMPGKPATCDSSSS